jgi:SAM-dependent methyltransferase
MTTTPRPEEGTGSISLDSFERMAEHYLHAVDTKPYNAYYERPATISLLPDVRGKRVVDAGCAAGWYTAWLLDRGASVLALDHSPRMVEMTKRRVGERAEVVRADLNRPLSMVGDGTVDVVLSSLVLHYLRDWGAVLGEFHRILRPGGHLVFSVHHPFGDFLIFKRENYFLTELLEDEWDTAQGKVKVHFYRRPLGQMIAPLIESGFVIEKLVEPMPTERFKAELPEAYERLTKRPQFLFFRARKPRTGADGEE